eukprot:COSAG01_NODE_7153_length_3328_cov_10.702694_5_plen_62_part_00
MLMCRGSQVPAGGNPKPCFSVCFASLASSLASAVARARMNCDQASDPLTRRSQRLLPYPFH